MSKIILFNTVHNDGVGDFSHFLDIYFALKNNPKLKKYELISVVFCADEQSGKIESRLASLGIKNCFYSKTEERETVFRNPILQQHLLEAEQIIQISFADNLKEYEKYFNPNAVCKFIGEHERGRPSYLTDRWISRSLGLSKNGFGLKFEKMNRLQSLDVTALFEENDKSFSESLLRYTNSSGFDEFHAKNLLIPAYFNGMESCLRFLLFLGINNNFSTDKDIAIYLSGDLGKLPGKLARQRDASLSDFKQKYSLSGDSDFSMNFEYHFYKPDFHGSHVNKIELIENGKNERLVEVINPEKGRTIRVFYGFNLSNKSYDALYQQAPIAGVSGDNTLEHAIAAKALPFYHSTNNKTATLIALSSIIVLLDLAEKIKADFLSYFDNLSKWANHQYALSQMPEIVEQFKELDLLSMVSTWPVIAEHIIKHHNFYDQLEKIFFENIQLDAALNPSGFFMKTGIEDAKQESDVLSGLRESQPRSAK